MISKWENFGHYLAGLWEGDGHSGKNPGPYIAITFHNKEYPLCVICQQLIGGFIRHKRQENAIVLTIQKRQELLKFVSLVGNKLRSPKSIEIWAIAKWLKTLDLAQPSNFCTQFELDSTPLFNNAWLAGFIDADGSFKVRYTKKKVNSVTKVLQTKERIALAFVIEQQMLHKKSGQSFKPLMDKIAKYLTVPLTFTKHKGKQYYCVNLSSFYKLKILIDYLEKYSLVSSKFLNYKDWCSVYKLMLVKKHLTSTGKSEIESIKKKMNSKRIHYDWSHIYKSFVFVIIEKHL